MSEREGLLVELLKCLRDVNGNLGSILNRTDGVVRRANLLLVLFILAIFLMLVQLGLGFSMQSLQKTAKVQLQMMDQSRQDLSSEVTLAQKNIKEMVVKLEAMQKQLDVAPSVTSDKLGRLSLAVPLTEDVKKVVSAKADSPAPEKVVIPLKASQSHLSQ